MVAIPDMRADLTGEDILPPLKSRTDNVAVIVESKKGTLLVKWLNPIHRGKHVNLAAAMNRGAHCVVSHGLDEFLNEISGFDYWTPA
jgi:hypothetical protein